MNDELDSIYQRAWTQREASPTCRSDTLGQYAETIAAWAHDVRQAYAALQWSGSHESWRAAAMPVALQLLGRLPAFEPPRIQQSRAYEHDGVVIEDLWWQLPYGPRTQAVLLKPVNATGRLPGVLGLHDHGGFKLYGKEKIVEQSDDARRPLLSDFRDMIYGGRCWANALAKRGYVVLVHDTFSWGSRRILGDDPIHGDTDSEAAAAAYNAWAGEHEADVFKALELAGMTYEGLVFSEDKIALSCLASREEVDASRLACGGLSGGAFRTIWLAGLDPRIVAAFVVGFLPTLRGLAYGSAFHHTCMAFVPGMSTKLDFADVLGLHAPRPTCVLQCEQDDLFPLSSMSAADEIMRAIYAKAGAPDAYHSEFHAVQHMFTPTMQDNVFDWLDRHL